MNTTVLYAELVVVGSGTAISIVLFFCSFFGQKSWLDSLGTLKDMSSLSSVVSLIPVLSVIYLLGIIVSNVGHVLFNFFLKIVNSQGFVGAVKKVIVVISKSINKSPKRILKTYRGIEANLYNKNYNRIKIQLYTYDSDKLDLKSLIEDFEFRRSKIRICRGWFINSFLIAVALFIGLRKGKIEESMAIFFIVLAFLLMILTVVSWYIATKTEISLLNNFNETSKIPPPQGE